MSIPESQEQLASIADDLATCADGDWDDPLGCVLKPAHDIVNAMAALPWEELKPILKRLKRSKEAIDSCPDTD